jgi:hypothetical protein
MAFMWKRLTLVRRFFIRILRERPRLYELILLDLKMFVLLNVACDMSGWGDSGARSACSFPCIPTCALILRRSVGAVRARSVCTVCVSRNLCLCILNFEELYSIVVMLQRRVRLSVRIISHVCKFPVPRTVWRISIAWSAFRCCPARDWKKLPIERI